MTRVPGESVDMGLVAAACLGFGVGGLSVAWTWTLYPPTKDHVWPIASVAAFSIAVVTILYTTAARLDVRRAGDWLVVGYALALVLAATLVVTAQATDALRDHVPSSIGVKRASRSYVEPPNRSRESSVTAHA